MKESVIVDKSKAFVRKPAREPHLHGVLAAPLR